jgi:redox-sensitive bicupin YhaK (pirin superfamily)
MIKILRSKDRGYFDHGWLKTHHSFSFGEYSNPAYQHFAQLRVINEDWIDPLSGFPEHPHKDMEILTYVISGTLTHRDNMGHTTEIHAGEMQYMSTGSGVTHSEYNADPSHAVHLLQIWLYPYKKNLPPQYQYKLLDPEKLVNRWYPVASMQADPDRIIIASAATVFVAVLQPQQLLSTSLDPQKSYWLQVISGSLQLSPTDNLGAGDGVALQRENELNLQLNAGATQGQLMLFELAGAVD